MPRSGGDPSPSTAQRGMLLIECMVVAALALALAVWGSHEWAERTRVLQARSLATWMGTARDAIQAYLVRDAATLAPDKVPGVTPDAAADAVRDAGSDTAPGAPSDSASDAFDASGAFSLPAPDWPTLQAQGLLAPGWQAVGPGGQTLGVHLWRGGGCQPAACRLNALVHTRSALQQRDGRPDLALVAEWLLVYRLINIDSYEQCSV